MGVEGVAGWRFGGAAAFARGSREMAVRDRGFSSPRCAGLGSLLGIVDDLMVLLQDGDCGTGRGVLLRVGEGSGVAAALEKRVAGLALIWWCRRS